MTNPHRVSAAQSAKRPRQCRRRTLALLCLTIAAAVVPSAAWLPVNQPRTTARSSPVKSLARLAQHRRSVRETFAATPSTKLRASITGDFDAGSHELGHPSVNDNDGSASDQHGSNRQDGSSDDTVAVRSYHDSHDIPANVADYASSTGTGVAYPPRSASDDLDNRNADDNHNGDDGNKQTQNSEVSPWQKAVNAAFLAFSFGYAVYTILNIDEGMTRGWSASEIAMRIPLDNWGNYESCLANQPVMTKTLINVIIYLLGDWLSQTAFAGNNLLNFDLSRTLRNGFIGLCFGPLVHEYYQFSDSILPPEDGLVTRIQKIFMDQTIYLTVKCSIYICAVGLLSGDDWSTVQQTVKDKIGGIVLTAWKFWPLVHCITYGLIPARHRILWVNSVDLVWNAILASKAQKGEDVTEDVTAAVAETIMPHSTDVPALNAIDDETVSILQDNADVAFNGRNVTVVTA